MGDDRLRKWPNLVREALPYLRIRESPRAERGEESHRLGIAGILRKLSACRLEAASPPPTRSAGTWDAKEVKTRADDMVLEGKST